MGKPEIIIPNTSRRQHRSRTRKFRRKVLHIVLSFLVGVTVTSIVHSVVMNQKIRHTVENVCIVFGRDRQKCKDGVDDLLNMADSVTQNNANISEGDK